MQKDKPLEDIVVHLSPTSKNFDQLFNFVDQLSTKLRVFVQFHRHGSIATTLNSDASIRNRLDNFDDLFEQLRLNLEGPRSAYDYGFTFIWKTCEIK
jgi:aspartokinase